MFRSSTVVGIMQLHSWIRINTLAALALSPLSVTTSTSTAAAAYTTTAIASTRLISTTHSCWYFPRQLYRRQQQQQHRLKIPVFLLSSVNGGGIRTETTDTADGITSQSSDWNEILPYQNSSHGSVKVIVPSSLFFTEQQSSSSSSSPLSPESSSSTVAASDDPFDHATFRPRLQATIMACREQQKSSIWVEVPMERARLIEEMSSLGFRFHHAQDHTAHLNLWLKEDVECKIPEYATHHVGVGAVVVNSRNEILCVRELRNNYMPWKIPGGLAELGEQIDEAVVREVLEETGVPTRFVNILAFRHSHGMANGRSDLFFVCRLEPVEEEDRSGQVVIPEPIAQQSEIEVAAWIPLSEYRNMVDQGHPMMRHVIKLYDQGQRIEKTVVQSIVPGRASNPIYHPSFLVQKQEESDSR